jgi:hypothetical protein
MYKAYKMELLVFGTTDRLFHDAVPSTGVIKAVLNREDMENLIWLSRSI